jgi:uncharacterized protein YutE (UPF0331/DUF86 family)
MAAEVAAIEAEVASGVGSEPDRSIPNEVKMSALPSDVVDLLEKILGDHPDVTVCYATSGTPNGSASEVDLLIASIDRSFFDSGDLRQLGTPHLAHLIQQKIGNQARLPLTIAANVPSHMTLADVVKIAVPENRVFSSNDSRAARFEKWIFDQLQDVKNRGDLCKQYAKYLGHLNGLLTNPRIQDPDLFAVLGAIKYYLIADLEIALDLVETLWVISRPSDSFLSGNSTSEMINYAEKIGLIVKNVAQALNGLAVFRNENLVHAIKDVDAKTLLQHSNLALPALESLTTAVLQRFGI